MSIVTCTKCNTTIDTDFNPAFYHKDSVGFDKVLCEECFVELSEDEQLNYEE